MKGRAIIKGISLRSVIRKTFPNDKIIKIYKNVQTGPNRYEGGDQDGLTSFEYHEYACILFF
jgi:hypothetical protein